MQRLQPRRKRLAQVAFVLLACHQLAAVEAAAAAAAMVASSVSNRSAAVQAPSAHDASGNGSLRHQLRQHHYSLPGRELHFGAKVALSILVAVILLVASATLFDILDDTFRGVRKRGCNKLSPLCCSVTSSLAPILSAKTASGAGTSTRQLVKQVFLSFSLCHSCSLIFQGSNKKNRKQQHQQRQQQQHQQQHQPLSIDSLHGLRFLSMIWIIVIHTYSFAFQWSFFRNTSENIYKTAASQLIANGAFACDSFFLIAGFLLPYLTFPAYKPSGDRIGGGSCCCSTISRATSRGSCSEDEDDHNNNSNSSSSNSNNNDDDDDSEDQEKKAEEEDVALPVVGPDHPATRVACNCCSPGGLLFYGSSGIEFTFKRLLGNLLHRYLRMMPLMMAVIGLSATILRYLGEGPQWDYSTLMYDKWCRKNWWINGLFLHNFINRENMCLSHSWYAAVDIQLFLLGQLILFVLARSKRLGILMCCVFLFGGQLITGALTLVYHLPALPLHASVSQQSMSLYYGEIYIKPYCRASPYLIGMVLAYLMRTTSLGSVQLKRWQTALGWSVSLGSLLLILMSTLPAMNGQPPGELESALYNALSRPLWACATGWMVFACITKHGGIFEQILSAPQFIPFSRLSYPAFLVHPIVMAISYGGRQASVPFSPYLMLCLVLGNIVITYASALVLSALFELPLLSVERAVKRQRP